jgi:crossover junction endodeoxyribonuclease RuvC
MKTIIGIDPGLTGCLASIDQDGNVNWGKIPIASRGEMDIRRAEIMLSSLRCHPDNGKTLAVIEKVHSMPKQGVASSFKFGKVYGQLQGICAGLGIPFILVTPQKWKKVVLEGYNWKGDKDISIQYVSNKYPDVSLLPTARSRKPDNNIADAICLAEYGWKQELVEPTLEDSDHE